MAIIRNDTDKTFTLTTKGTMYQLKIDDFGQLINTYYGEKMDYMDMNYATEADWGTSFSPNPFEKDDTGYSYNNIHQEIALSGMGDFRLTTMGVRNADGSYGAEPTFVSAKIEKGKYSIKGLPAFYGDNAETLVVTLKDKVHDIYFHMYYGVFEEYDLITRSVVVENKTNESIHLEKALSMALNLPCGSYDMLYFHGRHTRERILERTRINHAKVDKIGY